MFVLTEADNERVAFPVAAEDMESRLRTRRRIDDLEATLNRAVRCGAADQACEGDDGLFHHFIDGVYARELHIPADTLLVGKRHRFPRICILAAGEVSFATEFGLRRVAAPFTAVVPEGSKAAAYMHTDATWISVHAVDTADGDLDRIEAELVEGIPALKGAA